MNDPGLRALRPTVVLGGCNPFAAAEFGDALLTPQAFQHDPDFLSSADQCRRIARRMSLIASSAELVGIICFCLVVVASWRDDGPEPLLCRDHPICLSGADGEHLFARWAWRQISSSSLVLLCLVALLIPTGIVCFTVLLKWELPWGLPDPLFSLSVSIYSGILE
jgi:hypothetical protein